MSNDGRLLIFTTIEADCQAIKKQVPFGFHALIVAAVHQFSQIAEPCVGILVLDGHSAASAIVAEQICISLSGSGTVILHHNFAIFMQDNLKIQERNRVGASMELQLMPLDHGVSIRSFTEGLKIHITRSLHSLQVIPVNCDQCRHSRISRDWMDIVEDIAIGVPATLRILIIPGVFCQQDFTIHIHISSGVIVAIKWEAETQRDWL